METGSGRQKKGGWVRLQGVRNWEIFRKKYLQDNLYLVNTQELLRDRGGRHLHGREINKF